MPFRKLRASRTVVAFICSFSLFVGLQFNFCFHFCLNLRLEFEDRRTQPLVNGDFFSYDLKRDDKGVSRD